MRRMRVNGRRLRRIIRKGAECVQLTVKCVEVFVYEMSLSYFG